MNARTAIAPEGLSVGVNHLAFRNLRQHLQTKIIGQEHLVESLLVALLADGHLLVEGAPGLAKTTAIKELAAALQGDFRRLQFTPDLLPGDLTGTDVYRPETGDFHFQPGLWCAKIQSELARARWFLSGGVVAWGHGKGRAEQRRGAEVGTAHRP